MRYESGEAGESEILTGELLEEVELLYQLWVANVDCRYNSLAKNTRLRGIRKPLTVLINTP